MTEPNCAAGGSIGAGDALHAWAHESMRLLLEGRIDDGVDLYRKALVEGDLRRVPVTLHLRMLEGAGRIEAADSLREMAVREGVDVCVESGFPGADRTVTCEAYRSLFSQGLINSAMVARYLKVLADSGQAEPLAPWTHDALIWSVAISGEDTPFPADVARRLAELGSATPLRSRTQASHDVYRIQDVGQQGVPLNALLAAIRRSITDYLASLPVESRRALDWGIAEPKLAGWALLSAGPGYTDPHIHPRSWLTAVYYPQAPADFPESSDRGGWLRVALPRVGGSVVREICPRAGLLVLFPSFLWHWTTPFGGSGMRMAVAIDIWRA